MKMLSRPKVHPSPKAQPYRLGRSPLPARPLRVSLVQLSSDTTKRPPAPGTSPALALFCRKLSVTSPMSAPLVVVIENESFCAGAADAATRRPAKPAGAATGVGEVGPRSRSPPVVWTKNPPNGLL